MDVVHSATARAATAEPYTCAKCGYSGVGHAVAIEKATMKQGGLVFGNDRAGEMARDEAEARAWSEAMSDVAMAPCPRCGATDAAAWRSWITRPAYLLNLAIAIVTFLAGGLACSAVLTAANLLSVVCAGVIGLGFIVAGPLLVVLPLVGKRTSTRRVRFEPPR
ncbi:hypothetical protein [Sandaracinus amylolyticus]|uniref:hypothetical protein n=1 Tax=Sandaracinus amylolyticus TaxID=927083 RepID=UPI001F40A2F8|nr:hypothetical protein [Sandaracinus amylolyticus]UJR82207.1 Hypothetical protein I5071_42720 [Sandaracinus amylolyticus]